MNNMYTGTGVAIVTPFKDREVDYDQLRDVLDYVLDGGVDYIVALGSTGESATISDTEARSILDFIISHVSGRVAIVAGNFGGNNTYALVEKVKTYDFNGISAILSSSPSYSKPSQKGIYQHYTAIADECPIPVILYNVPSRTSSNIEADTTVKLSMHPNIIGIKEASGDIDQAKAIIADMSEDFFVTSGDDVLAPEIVKAGGVGVISVLANALPASFSDMITAYIDRDYTNGDQLKSDMADYHHWMYIDGNPSGVKQLMEYLQVCSAEVRLPLTGVSDKTKVGIKNLLG